MNRVLQACGLPSALLPPAAHAALWAPPAMTPRTPAPSPASSPMRATVRGRSPPRRLCVALRCGQCQAHAQRHSPARSIAIDWRRSVIACNLFVYDERPL